MASESINEILIKLIYKIKGTKDTIDIKVSYEDLTEVPRYVNDKSVHYYLISNSKCKEFNSLFSGVNYLLYDYESEAFLLTKINDSNFTFQSNSIKINKLK
jgi:hypothetical protein